MCFLKRLSYSTLFQNELLPPSSELVLHSWKCLMFPSGLGNLRHLHEWGTVSEDGAVVCHVKCITLGFMYFSSLRRTLSESWMTLHYGGCVLSVQT